MSNRRRLTPPPAVHAFAERYRCPDCLSYSTEPRLDTDGVWRLLVHHDDECPFLRGVASVPRSASD